MTAWMAASFVLPDTIPKAPYIVVLIYADFVIILENTT